MFQPPQNPTPKYQQYPMPQLQPPKLLNSTGPMLAQNNVRVVAQGGGAARPPSYLWLAIFTCLCCNALCGIAALILSAMSNGSSDDGDFEGGKFKGRLSLGVSLTGIFSTVILIIVVVLVYIFVIKSEVSDTVEDAEDYCYYLCDEVDPAVCWDIDVFTGQLVYNC